jgi:hypothetical protein
MIAECALAFVVYEALERFMVDGFLKQKLRSKIPSQPALPYREPE